MADWLDYPGLTRQTFSGLTPLPWFRDPAIIVLHSTEGGGYPGYAGGGEAPHFTVDMYGRTAHQHFPLSQASRGLVARPDGIHTNTGGAIQIEIIGSCVQGSSLPSVITPDDGAMAYLAGLITAIAQATGIKMQSSVSWESYPSSYGSGNGVRLGSAAWASYEGILGHQHVPDNLHGDPGNFDIARLLSMVGGPAPAPDPHPLLSIGSTGPAVVRVQQFLHIADDGIFGQQTYGAVKAYQASVGLDPDGVVGPLTWAKIEAGVQPTSNPVTPTPAPAPAPAPSGPVVIAPGVPAPPYPLPAGYYFGPKAGPVQSVSGYFSHRDDLRTWQQRMADRGWTITADGLYGPQTAGVAHDFQVEKHLTVDSLIGPQTWAAAWTEPVTR